MKRALILFGVVATLAGAALFARRAPDRFDHPKHAKLFPSCVACHAGTTTDASLFPAPTACASCHDGKEQRTVDWRPREGPRPSNLTFTHREHPKNTDCLSCHADQGAGWMQVRMATPTNCFACHGTRTEHLAQPDSTCLTCHVTLARAPATITAARVATFPAPPSHSAANFGAGGGHGSLAQQGTQSCATCHAKDFCAQCHLNGSSIPAIAALESDPRSVAIAVEPTGPTTHQAVDFERAHGRQAKSSIGTCANCHAQPNCTACHVTLPKPAERLAATDPRPTWAAAGRHGAPASHRAPDWESRHAGLASARPQNCAACHARSECLECHRPDAAQGLAGYHQAGFLASHPAQAYGRQSSCADCHNTQSFCQDCHQQSGIVANSRLAGGFHDNKPAFALGHGQAARQSLESCVSCHAERDCMSCHSQTRGRGFNPHGPGFNAERLKKKNPGMCAACHAAGSI